MNHSLIDYAAMWSATFALVFLLGIQSRNVQRSHYFAAILTSLGISIGNFTFIKFAAAGTFDAFAVCAVGGCMGIAFSIWFSDNVLHKRPAKGGQIAHKGPPLRFGEQVEGYHPLTPQMRLALEEAGRRAMRRTILKYPKLKCYECIGDDGCDGNCETKHLQRNTA